MFHSSHDTGSLKEQPFSQSPEQLKTMLNSLREHKFPIERLESLAAAADARRDLVSDFQRITGTNGNATRVMEELALYSRELHRGEKYLEQSQLPEKKGILHRSWEGVKSFAWKHPFVTATLVLALAAGGVATGFYLAGEWELLISAIGFNKIKGLAQAIEELSPVTPKTSPLSGGGAYDVSPPLPAPTEFPDVAH